ncbi:MAG: lipase [Clostridia bacterium]|nr:lipase [Clostridia bacterium]
MLEKFTYPIVFVHGLFGWGCDEGIDRKLPYWGATTGSLVDYLTEQGVECYSASVGPISSAWDRACELYARLTGTTVDYGAAHSARANHRRFGRTYTEPLVDGWGSEKKIHFIGHSFGGNTIRLLAHLLTYGDPDEQETTNPDELSGLFTGGKEDWVQSIVTICSPHNGTFALEAFRKYKILPMLQTIVYNGAAILGRSPAEGGFLDMHLEQYGISDTPGMDDASPLRRAKREYMKYNDNIEYDMSVEGAERINRQIKTSPNIYYFSYSFNAVKNDGKREKASETDFPFLKATSSLMRLYSRGMGADKQDSRNDGLVQVSAALHPSGDPFVKYRKQKAKPGVWYVMPTLFGDHGTPIGLFADPDRTHKFYLDMLTMLQNTIES